MVAAVIVIPFIVPVYLVQNSFISNIYYLLLLQTLLPSLLAGFVLCAFSDKVNALLSLDDGTSLVRKEKNLSSKDEGFISKNDYDDYEIDSANVNMLK